jgi:predicted nucleic acid-binding protein
VPGYLLDTNHIGAFLRKDPSVLQRLRAIPPESLIQVCTITLGEIEAGHVLTQTTDQNKRDEFNRLLNEEFLGYELEITASTRFDYAYLLGRIWHAHPPPSHRTSTEEHLRQLNVDINDVWIVSVAREHRLTFVTADEMRCIREAVGSDVRFECWLQQDS